MSYHSSQRSLENFRPQASGSTVCTLHHGRPSTVSARTPQSPLGSIASSRFSYAPLPTFELEMASTAVEVFTHVFSCCLSRGGSRRVWWYVPTSFAYLPCSLFFYVLPPPHMSTHPSFYPSSVCPQGRNRLNSAAIPI